MDGTGAMFSLPGWTSVVRVDVRPAPSVARTATVTGVAVGNVHVRLKDVFIGVSSNSPSPSRSNVSLTVPPYSTRLSAQTMKDVGRPTRTTDGNAKSVITGGRPVPPETLSVFIAIRSPPFPSVARTR